MENQKPTYETDFYGWAINTISLLKEGKIMEVNVEYLIEEIEDSIWRTENEFEKHIIVLMSDILRWKFQPEKNDHNPRFRIRQKRKWAKKILNKNPSLKSNFDEILIDCYQIAILTACIDTGLEEDAFPKECPYTFEQLMDPEFLPEAIK